MEGTELSREMISKLENSIIDSRLTLEILKKYNRGDYDRFKAVTAESFPPVDNRTIVDMSDSVSFGGKRSEMEITLESYSLDPEIFLPRGREDYVMLEGDSLTAIGKALMPLYSFGILNGGSASSYGDSKKNRSFSKDLFGLLEPHFETLSNLSRGKAKGITPAFINPDGTAGPSFIELKMRALLIAGCPSLFQMTSYFNNTQVEETYREYEKSPYLKDLIKVRNNNICRALTGTQPLLAAYTHSREGKNKTLFLDKEGELLPMPGGHGQCFITLKDIFTRLHKEGKRFISIGNVDNSGYTPDPLSLALLALSGKQAGFDFSFKTAVDVKGGILVRDDRGMLNCADIGVAIDSDTVEQAVDKGEHILFNCATGLFNLDYLMEYIDMIIDALPMRFSDQDKDAGLYSQAEQVTWEVIGILDDILIFAVDKYDRFLAAKTIMETLMTSGISLDSDHYPPDLKDTAERLSRGFEQKLATVYGLELIDSRWQPLPPEKLELN